MRGGELMKKVIGIIIAFMMLIYLFFPFKVSDDKIIYVDKGNIWSGTIETNKFKSILSKTFITNAVFICANIADKEKIYQLKEGDNIYSLTYDKHKNVLYAITENKSNGTYSIKAISNGKENMIINLSELNQNYFGLYYHNGRLYYWVDDKNTEKKFLEIFNLKNSCVERRIQVAVIGENVSGLGNRMIFSTKKGNKSNIYSIMENGIVDLFITGMDTPIKITNTEMIYLDGVSFNNIYLYDLESAKRTVFGKNDGRAWYRNAFALSNKRYYVTEKKIHAYDIQEWYTINDLEGGMQILHVDGPVISSIQ